MRWPKRLIDKQMDKEAKRQKDKKMNKETKLQKIDKDMSSGKTETERER